MSKENFLIGFWLSNKLYKSQPHNSYKSKHGSTIKGGLHAPAEGGGIWKTWIPVHNEYLYTDIINKKQAEKIKNNINAVINKYNKPFIIKNNYNSLRIRIIKEIFPNAKIIFIKREPLSVAQSIIKARENIYGDRESWWSVKPPNYDEIKNMYYPQQVIKQIYFIEKKIVEDLKKFNKNRVLIINYTALSNLHECINNFKFFLGDINIRDNVKLEKIKINRKEYLEPEIISILKAEIEKYDWENYSS